VSLPGGVSGVLGSPFYLNLLPAWLTNEDVPVAGPRERPGADIVTVTHFVPARNEYDFVTSSDSRRNPRVI
jgi:hypothetical protein